MSLDGPDGAPPLPILYRDDVVAVVDKPAGLATHRGWAPEPDVAVARARRHLGQRVFAVHRLDRGTSGALVLALTAEAARALGAAFAEGRVRKMYLALVRGLPPPSGLVDHAIQATEDRQGPRVEARTAYRRLEVFGRYSLVEAEPLTGRLHQIRRHMKHLSCPLIGDVKYGKGPHNRLFRERLGLHRMFLHAARVRFPHPDTGAPLEVEAPLAAELVAVLETLRTTPLPII
jgi:tRNA pseudouridine65 synthase